ncbi:MAG: pyridoxal kinase PdxY [Iodobacter sp.]
MNILSIQSHVVYGHAGNSAAVFAMQRSGLNVWPVHTVQFSNHTQYGQWRGQTLDSEVLQNIVQGMDDIGVLSQCDAILTGYLGSLEQAVQIKQIVNQVRSLNPGVWYLCDPVMGNKEKGCIVAAGIESFLINEMPQIADIMAPNHFELENLSGIKIQTMEDALAACRILISRGPKIVLAKNIKTQDKPHHHFGMLVVSKDEAWYGCRPLYPFQQQPVGVGDLTSGLFLAQLLKGDSICHAFRHTLAAVDAVVARTWQDNCYELQIIAAQDSMVEAPHKFPVIDLLHRPGNDPSINYRAIWC